MSDIRTSPLLVAWLVKQFAAVSSNKTEFIDQNKELCPDYYDAHMYRYFRVTATGFFFV